MSLRQWNSVAERARLQHYVLLAEMMLEEEDGDSSDDDSEASGGMPMEMEFIIDQELSFITGIDDNDAEEEEGDEEHNTTVDHVIRSTMAYSNFIYQPILDELIDFTMASVFLISALSFFSSNAMRC